MSRFPAARLAARRAFPLLALPLLALAPGAPAAAQAADALAIGHALRLPAAALRRVEAHAARLAGAPGAKPGPATACDALGTADAVRAALYDALAPRLAEAGAAERQLARELLAGLALALPGVGARLGAAEDAPLEAGVDYTALGLALPLSTPGRALLLAAGGLREPAGRPAYLRASALPGTPCADFSRVLGPLARLAPAWQAAPACLRARLQPALREVVVKMGEQADFCTDEPRARHAAAEAARLLARLPGFGGPGTGKRIGHNFRSYGLRFGLAP